MTLTAHTFDNDCIDIAALIDEDLGSGDLTAALISAEIQAEAEVVTREPMILCGRRWFDAVFHYFDASTSIEWQAEDGESIAPGNVLCRLHGPARALLSGERTALNILQTLSATATVAKRYAEAVSGTDCKVLDTRKTIPGLRRAQKYAVRCGGCHNHRMGLYDAILIKENHIMAAGSLTHAVKLARQSANVAVEVEVENLTEFAEACASRPDRIMLDNFSHDDMRNAVALRPPGIELEASGNVDLHNIRSYAETGVDFISVGALTKNVNAIDLSMRIKLAKP